MATSASGVLNTGDPLVDGEGGSGAGEDVRRAIVLENGRRNGAGVLIGTRELSAEARWRHRWQIMANAAGC